MSSADSVRPAVEASRPATTDTFSAFGWALRRDLTLALRRKSATLNLVGFFVLSCICLLYTSDAADEL